MRRRELLAGLATLTGATAIPPDLTTGRITRDASPGIAAGIIDALVQRTPIAYPPDTSLTALRRDLREVKTDFQTCRYQALGVKLPRLLTAVSVLDGTTGCQNHGVRAEIYNTAAHVLIKLGIRGPSWVAADRAMAAAKTSGDPVIAANVTRNIVTLCRGERRYHTAQQLALDAANHLDLTGAPPDPAHVSLYGMLLCNAGYAAAQAGDRDHAADLFEAADTAARLLGTDHNHHWTAFGPTNVTLHRLSAALALGDPGDATRAAKAVKPAGIQVVERRARYWVDVARAYYHWNKPEKCLHALMAAERLAPEEVRHRPVVKTLTASLLTAPSIHTRDLQDFVTRIRLRN